MLTAGGGGGGGKEPSIFCCRHGNQHIRNQRSASGKEKSKKLRAGASDWRPGGVRAEGPRKKYSMMQGRRDTGRRHAQDEKKLRGDCET